MGTTREFDAYKKSTGCTCDRAQGEMHGDQCPLYPAMRKAIERQERIQREWLKDAPPRPVPTKVKR